MGVLDDLLTGRVRALLLAGSLLIAFGVDLDRTVDLFGTVPLAVTVHGLSSFRLPPSSAARLSATLGGGVMTVAWSVAALRWGDLGTSAPALAWGFAIATTAGSIVLVRRLAGAVSPAAFASISATYEVDPRVVAARLA